MRNVVNREKLKCLGNIKSDIATLRHSGMDKIILLVVPPLVMYVTLQVSSKELVWLFLIIEFILMQVWNINILAN
jgi:hypothetical protein